MTGYTESESENVRTYPNGWRVEIVPDPEPMDPREWDHVGEMACAHGRYHLGDWQVPEGDWGSWAEVADHLRRDRGARCLLPLYLFDHSGLSMTTDAATFARWDSAGWDWGQVGWIYATTERLRMMGCEGWKSDRIRKALRAEVAEYDAYLRGNVVGYVVRDADGEVRDSCWGFYPEDGPEPFAYVWTEGEAMLPDMAGVMLAHAGMGI